MVDHRCTVPSSFMNLTVKILHTCKAFKKIQKTKSSELFFSSHHIAYVAVKSSLTQVSKECCIIRKNQNF